MPVTASDLVQYGAASRPEDDASTSGGAIDTAARPIDTPLASNSDVEALSDGADTRTLTLTYRDAAGVIQTGNIVLSGTTPVALGATVERILKAVLSASDGSRTVTLRVASAGATIHTFNPTETAAFRMFYAASSDPSVVKTRYEKIFWRNENGSLALTSAEVTLTADASSKFEIGLEGAKGGTGSVADRETAPGAVSFVDDGVAVGVPTGSLGAGEEIGVWVKQTLAAGDSPGKPSFTTQLTGTST